VSDTLPECEEFRVKYDGEGIRDGQIDAKALAESLLALTTLLERSNKLLNGRDSEIAVKVRANMQPGSFVVNIVNFFTKIGELGSSPIASGWVNVVALLGVGGTVAIGTYKTGKTLFKLLKEARGQNVARKMVKADAGVVAILDDGTEIEGLSNEVLDLYEDMVVRHSVENMSQILNSDSIASMEFFGNNGDTSSEKWVKEDLPALKAPVSDILLENEAEKILIVSVASVVGEPSGWRFKENADSHDFAADILDESFLKKIKTRELGLRCGDMLRAKLLTQQTRPRRNLKTTYTVLRVVAYIPYEDVFEEEQSSTPALAARAG
jgi:hypothetical protein